MPYIPQQDRIKFKGALDGLEFAISREGLTNGELNYLLTQVCLNYLNHHGTSYNTLGDVVKAMECAKLEFYRRMVAPYEDKKAEQNGDVYPTTK